MTDMTYKGSGVNYDSMDPFKRIAQAAGLQTAEKLLHNFNFNEVEMSRGESVYLIETPDHYLAHVEEGLGTKNLVADAMHKLTGKSYYDHIAQDTVAMIVNDMITLGAMPLSVAMHLAVGSSDWFEDQKRCNDLIKGWMKACMRAGCAWGGGETPTLKDIVIPGTVVLSGSAMGIIKSKDELIKCNIQAGDEIIILESSGIHANGLTLARKIAEKLPDGYLTKLSDGRSFGESLLDPTLIYVPFIRRLLEKKVDIHYAVNITGHGWRKLMRANESFAYVIEFTPRVHPVFEFIQKHGPVSTEEAYGNFNMGAGFAVIVPSSERTKVLTTARIAGFFPVMAGHVEQSTEKKVIIKEHELEYKASSLQVR